MILSEFKNNACVYRILNFLIMMLVLFIYLDQIVLVYDEKITRDLFHNIQQPNQVLRI